MPSPAQESDRILASARRSLADQRAGGRRVMRSIGRGSAQLKFKHFTGKLRNIALALFGIWVAVGLVGIVIDGIGFTGIFLAALATIVATGVLARYPRMAMPTRSDLSPADTDVKRLVGRTELWLESQRLALPPPAVTLVDQIGLQLDALGVQLEGVDPAHPAAAEVRKLVGEHLPDIVDGYRKIPPHLRYEQRAGATPDDQFVAALGTISGEIDSVTRQLAGGAIDNLAIKTRFLDYKYGAALEERDAPRP